MSTISLSHRWRETPLPLTSLEDVPACIELAKKARGAVLDFEWTLDRASVERLRDAVHAWGAGVRGRYRRFDARVLAAIADALGEYETVYRLSAPSSGDDGSSHVTCAQAGEAFRLSGHVGADVLLGYCLGGWKGRARLGDELVEAFQAAGRELGWDAGPLNEPRMQAVLNALYGFPLEHGIDAPRDLGPVEGSMDVHFQGPFRALPGVGRRCLFDVPLKESAGVYVWTVPVGDVHHAFYVGQTTRSFGVRMLEHFQSFLSGTYSVLAADRLAHGEKRVIWAGQTSAAEASGQFGEFLGRLESLAPHIRKQIDMIRVHVAPLDPEGRLFNRIEGALGRHFRDNDDLETRRMFDSQVRVPAAIPGETRTLLRITSETPIVGLPGELPA